MIDTIVWSSEGRSLQLCILEEFGRNVEEMIHVKNLLWRIYKFDGFEGLVLNRSLQENPWRGSLREPKKGFGFAVELLERFRKFPLNPGEVVIWNCHPRHHLNREDNP